MKDTNECMIIPIFVFQSEVVDGVSDEEGSYMELEDLVDEDEGVGMEDVGDNRKMPTGRWRMTMRASSSTST